MGLYGSFHASKGSFNQFQRVLVPDTQHLNADSTIRDRRHQVLGMIIDIVKIASVKCNLYCPFTFISSV